MTSDSTRVAGFVTEIAARLARAELVYGHGTGNAADEAAFLVLESLRLPVDDIETVADRLLTEPERMRIEELAKRRIDDRVPASYLVGAAYVGPYRFASDERALVPRSFIGELLVAGMGEEEPLPFVSARSVLRILEIGTGSGCLAILAALAFPRATIDAVDISADALTLARANVDAYALRDRITLLEGDLYGPVVGRRYDLIITNPPYVTEASMDGLPAEYRREPAVGLAGGADGLDLVRRIVAGAGDRLEHAGGLICEVGAGQEAVMDAYPNVPFLWLDTEDSAGEVFWVDAAALSPQ